MAGHKVDACLTVCERDVGGRELQCTNCSPLMNHTAYSSRADTHSLFVCTSTYLILYILLVSGSILYVLQ